MPTALAPPTAPATRGASAGALTRVLLATVTSTGHHPLVTQSRCTPNHSMRSPAARGLATRHHGQVSPATRHRGPRSPAARSGTADTVTTATASKDRNTSKTSLNLAVTARASPRSRQEGFRCARLRWASLRWASLQLARPRWASRRWARRESVTQASRHRPTPPRRRAVSNHRLRIRAISSHHPHLRTDSSHHLHRQAVFNHHLHRRSASRHRAASRHREDPCHRAASRHREVPSHLEDSRPRRQVGSLPRRSEDSRPRRLARPPCRPVSPGRQGPGNSRASSPRISPAQRPASKTGPREHSLACLAPFPASGRPLR
jgi:hypothetical protein